MQKIEPENLLDLLEPLIIPLDHNTYNMKRVYEGTIYFKITFKNKEGYRPKLNVFNLKKNEREKVRYKLAVYASLWVLKCRSFNLHIYPH